MRQMNAEEININKFEAVLLSVLTEDERSFYNQYIDYIELENDPYVPVLKFYFNENDYIKDGITKGYTIDETLKAVSSIEMIAKSLFERMHGFRVLTEEVTYGKLKKVRNETTRLSKALTKYEMLEMELEEANLTETPLVEQERKPRKQKNKVIKLFNFPRKQKGESTL